ncbi:twitching motility protein PilT [Vibrio harveyi]|uniref:lytic transglycosylase domain-containing protein n=1 Tax=Vibrio TaxID=662 RepID=UPI000A8B97C2|nr:lytic transglycosylase domain-containing protein [Vibrio harveyi]GBL02322.1 twitching motility protein PilT [Vibrio harveyi]
MKFKMIFVFLVPFQTSAFCFDEAGQYYNVSPDLLRAISQVESSLDPAAYNENKNAAGKITSRDFGLMQINSIWFSKLADLNVNEKNVYEPCFNVSLGAWVLSTNFATHGYNWNSIGAYNAGFSKRTENARKIYIQKVQSVYYSAKVK